MAILVGIIIGYLAIAVGVAAVFSLLDGLDREAVIFGLAWPMTTTVILIVILLNLIEGLTLWIIERLNKY